MLAFACLCLPLPAFAFQPRPAFPAFACLHSSLMPRLLACWLFFLLAGRLVFLAPCEAKLLRRLRPFAILVPRCLQEPVRPLGRGHCPSPRARWACRPRELSARFNERGTRRCCWAYCGYRQMPGHIMGASFLRGGLALALVLALVRGFLVALAILLWSSPTWRAILRIVEHLPLPTPIGPLFALRSEPLPPPPLWASFIRTGWHPSTAKGP